MADCVKILLPCHLHIFYLILDAFNPQFRVFWCAGLVKLSPWPQRTTGDITASSKITSRGSRRNTPPFTDGCIGMKATRSHMDIHGNHPSCDEQQAKSHGGLLFLTSCCVAKILRDFVPEFYGANENPDQRSTARDWINPP